MGWPKKKKKIIEIELISLKNLAHDKDCILNHWGKYGHFNKWY